MIFTGDWSMPVKEAEATNILIDKGCDVFTCHVDSPKVIVETAEKAGKMMTAATTPARPSWPQGLSDRRRVELGKGLHRIRQEDPEGREASQLHPRRPEGRHRQDGRRTGQPSRREAKKEADAAKEKFMDGDFVIFKGPLKARTTRARKSCRPARSTSRPIRRWKR